MCNDRAKRLKTDELVYFEIFSRRQFSVVANCVHTTNADRTRLYGFYSYYISDGDLDPPSERETSTCSESLYAHRTGKKPAFVKSAVERHGTLDIDNFWQYRRFDTHY